MRKHQTHQSFSDDVVKQEAGDYSAEVCSGEEVNKDIQVLNKGKNQDPDMSLVMLETRRSANGHDLAESMNSGVFTTQVIRLWESEDKDSKS